jgi:hypothetical protein
MLRPVLNDRRLSSWQIANLVGISFALTGVLGSIV